MSQNNDTQNTAVTQYQPPQIDLTGFSPAIEAELARLLAIHHIALAQRDRPTPERTLQARNYDSAIVAMFGYLDGELPTKANLERWRDEILARDEVAEEVRPDRAIEILRNKLEAAVAAEQFEEAARLRDQIHRLSQSQ